MFIPIGLWYHKTDETRAQTVQLVCVVLVEGIEMTLDEGKIHASYIVESMQLPIQIAKRLEALGMIAGTSVAVLNNKSRGTMIIQVRGTRFAIGRGISKNIQVRTA